MVAEHLKYHNFNIPSAENHVSAAQLPDSKHPRLPLDACDYYLKPYACIIARILNTSPLP